LGIGKYYTFSPPDRKIPPISVTVKKPSDPSKGKWEAREGNPVNVKDAWKKAPKGYEEVKK